MNHIEGDFMKYLECKEYENYKTQTKIVLNQMEYYTSPPTKTTTKTDFYLLHRCFK